MPYSAFLLPLLDTGSVPPLAVPGSPAEEERCLSRLGETVWSTLESRVREAYGHDFITRLPDTQPVEVLRRITASGLRLLLVRMGDHPTVLLEHPSGMALADQEAPEGAAILIARPRLFLALWREAETVPPARHAPTPPAVAASSLTETLLAGMARRPGVSDWHLIPSRDQYASLTRVDGRLIRLPALGRDEGLSRIHAICSAAGMESAPPRAAVEGRLHLGGGASAFTARVSLVPSHFGPALNVRFLPDTTAAAPSLEALGMDPPTLAAVRKRFARQEGLWLVAGPTGSGKSTTLHALLRLAASNHEKVLSIEDPVERTLAGVQQMSVNSPPGLTYAIALKASLRQAPNTLMIGEIRDPETAAIALQAARAGHRVLTTLHARDTRGLLARLEDLGQCPEDVRRLQPVLLHQRLLPRLCPSCGVRGRLPDTWESLFRARGLTPPDAIWESTGCGQCDEGHCGRLALFALDTVSAPDGTDSAFLAAARGPLERGELGLARLASFLHPRERQSLSGTAAMSQADPPHLRENGSGLPLHFGITHPS